MEEGDLGRRFFTFADGILIAILVVIGIALCFRESIPSEKLNGYRISVVGHPERELFLINRPPSGLVSVAGILGNSIVEWDAQGRFRIASSPCPNKLCIQMGWVSPPPGVCCIPNGVVVECQGSDWYFDGETK